MGCHENYKQFHYGNINAKHKCQFTKLCCMNKIPNTYDIPDNLIKKNEVLQELMNDENPTIDTINHIELINAMTDNVYETDDRSFYTIICILVSMYAVIPVMYCISCIYL